MSFQYPFNMGSLPGLAQTLGAKLCFAELLCGEGLDDE